MSEFEIMKIALERALDALSKDRVDGCNSARQPSTNMDGTASHTYLAVSSTLKDMKDENNN